MHGMKKILEAEHILLPNLNLMNGAYMTCTAMYGSGVRIIGMMITMEHLMMGVPGWSKVRLLSGSCAAARGATSPRTVGRLTATGAAPSTDTTASGSGLSAFQVSLVSQAGKAGRMRSAESIDTSARRPEGRRPESDVAYRWSTEHPGVGGSSYGS
jgi:hypothetical protein